MFSQKVVVFGVNLGSWSIQGLLFLLTFSIFIFWYITYLWRRRYMYIYSRKIPGPPSFPLIGSAHLFMADFSPKGILNVLMNIQESYPGLCKMWIGPHLVYFLTEPELVMKVLTNKNALNKNYIYDFIIRGIGTGILTSPAAKWKKHRKLISPLFSQKYLNSYVPVFSKHAMIFTNKLGQYVGKKNIDMFSLCSRLTLDATFENLTGISASTQTTNSIFPKLFERTFEIVLMRAFDLWLQFDTIFNLSSLSKEFDAVVNKFRCVTDMMVETRTKQFVFKKMLEGAEFTEEETEEEMKTLLDTAVERSYFTEKDLRQELEVLIMAANDTSAATLTAMFEMLGIHQDVQQKVYEEAIEVLGKDREVEAIDLPKLKYIEMVLQETLRLFPPVSITFRSIGEDIDLGDAVLPKGSSTCVSSYFIQRKPTLWPDPLKFDPNRFLPEEVAKRHPCAHIPFSYGPRNCIGYQYGMMNLKVILATVIRKYKFTSDYKSMEDVKTKLSLFLRLEEGSKVSVSPREDV